MENSTLKVVPVIDIRNGIAVHAVKGRRSEYQPLKSVLCPSANPLDVALTFRKLGFSELYIADLDAILTGHPNFAVLKQIASATGLSLMVDAGVANLERAEKLVKSNVTKVIIGTETLPRLSFVREAVETLGKKRVVVSLDLKGGEVLSGFELGKFSSPLDLLLEFQEMGVKQVIVLDLARVGSGEGVNTSFLASTLNNLGVKVLVGGGVRGITDLTEIRNMGTFGVLIATALHSGEITVEQLKQAGLFQ